MKNTNKAYVGLAISALFAFLVVEQIDWSNVGQALGQTSSGWLVIALAFYWLEIGLRIARWRRILACAGSATGYPLVGNAFCVCAAANNILPLRIGDILRAHLVGIPSNNSRYALLGTIVLEKLIDVVAILALTCWGAFGVLSQVGAISKVSSVLLIAGGCLFVAASMYFLWKDRFLGGGWAAFIAERVVRFSKGFAILAKPKNLSLVLVETALLWALNTLAIWALIRSLGVSLSASEVLLLEGITGLAAAIPSAPAGVGTLQYAFILTFGLLHADKSVGVAASLLVQGVLLGSITLVGMLILAFDATSRQALRRIRHG